MTVSTGISWNTAALSDTLKNEITFMSNKWAQETSHTFLGMRRPLSSGGIGIGIIWLDYGEFERRDEYGVLLPDEFSPYDFASIIGVGYPVTESLSFGTALYLIKEKMDKESAETYSLNLDTLYKRGRMRVSCGFKNIGGKIKGFSLQRELKLGVAFSEEGLVISGDMTISPESKGKINFGSEFRQEIFSARMGYEQPLQGEGLTRLGFRGGFGIRIKGLEIDYAFIPQGIFGNTSCISVNLGY